MNNKHLAALTVFVGFICYFFTAAPPVYADSSYQQASEEYSQELSAKYNRGEISWEEAERRAVEFDTRWNANQRQQQLNAIAFASATQTFVSAQQQAQANTRPAQIIDLRGDEYNVYNTRGSQIGTMRKKGPRVIYGN